MDVISLIHSICGSWSQVAPHSSEETPNLPTLPSRKLLWALLYHLPTSAICLSLHQMLKGSSKLPWTVVTMNPYLVVVDMNVLGLVFFGLHIWV